jgi:hypothetical protein
MADAKPPTAVTAPAARPHVINPTVTVFGDHPKRAKTQVAPGDTRLM